ncbi:hypothetical protein CB1_000995011 [Camelus ferus]|nr:hypothetical protein CB1_000995011 [Camelus ferus]
MKLGGRQTGPDMKTVGGPRSSMKLGGRQTGPGSSLCCLLSVILHKLLRLSPISSHAPCFPNKTVVKQSRIFGICRRSPAGPAVQRKGPQLEQSTEDKVTLRLPQLQTWERSWGGKGPGDNSWEKGAEQTVQQSLKVPPGPRASARPWREAGGWGLVAEEVESMKGLQETSKAIEMLLELNKKS